MIISLSSDQIWIFANWWRNALHQKWKEEKFTVHNAHNGNPKIALTHIHKQFLIRFYTKIINEIDWDDGKKRNGWKRAKKKIVERARLNNYVLRNSFSEDLNRTIKCIASGEFHLTFQHKFYPFKFKYIASQYCGLTCYI